MRLLSKMPAAVAKLRGNSENSGLVGTVRFYQFPGAVLVEADVMGLPNNGSGFHGFHIHTGAACTGETFEKTGGHYDPAGKPHPLHAGDLPPVLARNGRAYLAVMTDRFSVADVEGRTVVIHRDADDFRSQPAGDAGQKIACGVIERYPKRRQLKLM